MTKELSQILNEKVEEFYKDGIEQQTFDDCFNEFHEYLEIGEEYREEFRVICALADVGEKKYLLIKKGDNNGQIEKGELIEILKNIPKEKTTKERMFGEWIFNLLRKDNPVIYKAEFRRLFYIMTFTKDTDELVIEPTNTNIESSKWKDYLVYFDKNDGVFDELFNIVAEERKEFKEKVITLERFISWYNNCC